MAFCSCVTTSCDFSLMMSLLAMSLGDGFCVSRKSETRGDGWIHPKGEKAWSCLGLARKSPWSKQGGPFYLKYVWNSPLNFPNFLRMIFQLEQARITSATWSTTHYEWVWLELWIYLGWLNAARVKFGPWKPERTVVMSNYSPSIRLVGKVLRNAVQYACWSGYVSRFALIVRAADIR